MIVSSETVLSIVLAVENKGIEVYQALQERFHADFLEFMIGQEKEHIRMFQDLFGRDRGAAGSHQFETSHLDEDYLVAAYAETEVFGKLEPQGLEEYELYQTAIQMEKDSILLYSELLDMLPDRAGDQARLLSSVQAEEKQHLLTLIRRREDFAVHTSQPTATDGD